MAVLPCMGGGSATVLCERRQEHWMGQAYRTGSQSAVHAAGGLVAGWRDCWKVRSFNGKRVNVTRTPGKCVVRERGGQSAMLAASLLFCTWLGSGFLTGCVVVGASSRGGFFVWPGGLGLLLMGLILFLMLRRR